MYRMLQAQRPPAAQREPLRGLRPMAEDERPFPPGEYPVVVVGSGPGGLQISYFLGRLGIDHAVDLGRPVAGRHVPTLAVLPAPPVVDQAVRPGGARARGPSSAGTGTACSRPSRSCAASRPSSWTARRTSRRGRRWRRTSRAFAERAGVAIRYGCRWERPAARRPPDGDRFIARRRRDGEYRCRLPDLRRRRRRAVQPVDARASSSRSTTPIPATAESYAGQAPVHHRQAELRLRARVGPPPVGEPDQPVVAVAGQDLDRDALAGRRPGALRPAVRGLDPRRRGRHPVREHQGHQPRARTRPAGRPRAQRQRDADERRGGRGHRRDRLHCPLLDLPALGVATFGQAKLPAQTDFWESATVPGIYFAGTITPGRRGPQEARHPAQLRRRPRLPLQRPRPRRSPRREALRRGPRAAGDPAPATCATTSSPRRRCAPELWHQKAYLASVVSLDPTNGHPRRGHRAAHALPRRRRVRCRRDDDRGRRHVHLPRRLRPPGRPPGGARPRRPTRSTTSRA